MNKFQHIFKTDGKDSTKEMNQYMESMFTKEKE